MFFWILFLAHVIGDFPLQTDSIFQLKTRYAWGVIPHVLICTAVNIFFLTPFLHERITLFVILFLLVIHAFLDKTKIRLAQKKTQDNFGQFLLDQFFHLTSVWIAALLLNRWISLTDYTLFGMDISQSDLVIATAFVLAVFAGTPVLYYTLKNIYRQELGLDHRGYPMLPNRFPGFIERAVSLFGLITGSWFIILYPAAFLPKLLLDKKNTLKLRLLRFAAGLGFVALCGLLVFVFG